MKNTLNNHNYFKLAQATSANYNVAESFYHKLIHKTKNHRVIEAQSKFNFDKVSTPEFNDLTKALFSKLPDDTALAIKILSERVKRPDYAKLFQHIKEGFFNISLDENYLSQITQTAMSSIGHDSTFNQVSGIASQAFSDVENKYLNFFGAIEKGAFAEEKPIKSALNKFKSYLPRVDIAQFLKVFIFGGTNSDFSNRFIKLLEQQGNTLNAGAVEDPEMKGSGAYDSGQKIIQQGNALEVSHQDLRDFAMKWEHLGPKHKEDIIAEVLDELQKENPDLVEGNLHELDVLKAGVKREFQKLNSYVVRYKGILHNPAESDVLKGYKITRLLKLMGNDKLIELSIKKILAHQFEEGDDSARVLVHTDNTRNQLRRNNKEVINGIVTGVGKLHHGFKNGNDFTEANTIKASVLPKEYISGLLWARTLLGNPESVAHAEKILDSSITNEANKLSEMPPSDEMASAMIRHHLFNYLFLNAIFHASAVYAPKVGAGKAAGRASTAFKFETIVIDFLRQEFTHYSIPTNLIQEFENIAAELMDTENFRYIRSKTDIMRRELAESYATHLLGFKIEQKLTPEQIDLVADQVYQLLYPYGSKNFSVRNNSGAAGTVIPDIQKPEMLEVIKKELEKRNDVIIEAAQKNPDLRVEQLPINWRNIMGSEAEHQDKFFVGKNKKDEISLANHNIINLRTSESSEDTLDVVYLKWLVKQGIV